MLVILDTNVLFEDPVMVRDVSRNVFDLLGPARATLVFSPVVLGELNRKRLDDVDDLDATIRSRVKRLAALSAVDSASLLAEARAMVDAAAERWTTRWAEILDNENVEVGEWPEAGSQLMGERELGRRRPFMEKDPGTIGHRDTLIWLGVVELARDEPDEDIVFVTADKGFLSGVDLHAHLLEDLEAVGARNAVRRIGSMHALVTELEKALETSGWESWRAPSVAEVLYEEIQKLEAYDFAPYWDDREGGTAAPTFDVGLPASGNDWTLTHVDGPQNLELDDAEFGADELSCTFLIDIQLSGFMDKFDWYSDDHPAVDLWDADWNDHVVSVDATRRLRFRARFEIDDREEMAVFEEFLEAEVVPDPG